MSGPISIASRVRALRASRAFSDLRSEELVALSSLCTELSFEKDETVVRANEPGNEMYVVLEGRVKVLAEGGHEGATPTTLAVLGPGEFFGEMSLLEKRPRSATVRAAADTVLLALSRDDFYAFAKRFRNGFAVVVINIARVLSARLRETTQRLVETGAGLESSGCA